VIADILGVPVRWRPTSGGTSLGAAFLGAMALDDHLSFADLGSWLEPTLDTFPNPSTFPIYNVQYDIFCSLYGRLKDYFPRLNAIPDVNLGQ
jgi:sugar (pentulose or hexulose) kinase